MVSIMMSCMKRVEQLGKALTASRNMQHMPPPGSRNSIRSKVVNNHPNTRGTIPLNDSNSNSNSNHRPKWASLLSKSSEIVSSSPKCLRRKLVLNCPQSLYRPSRTSLEATYVLLVPLSQVKTLTRS